MTGLSSCMMDQIITRFISHYSTIEMQKQLNTEATTRLARQGDVHEKSCGLRRPRYGQQGHLCFFPKQCSSVAWPFSLQHSTHTCFEQRAMHAQSPLRSALSNYPAKERDELYPISVKSTWQQIHTQACRRGRCLKPYPKWIRSTVCLLELFRPTKLRARLLIK